MLSYSQITFPEIRGQLPQSAEPPIEQTLKQNWRQNSWDVSLIAILIIALVVFLLVLPSYGVSFDEPSLYAYADRSLEAYKSLILEKPLPSFESTYALPYYGPAYLIAGRVVVGMILAIAPALDLYHAWHIVNFINFLIGAWLIYLLAQRVASKPAAWTAAMLYLTQPLLWGHGVMNPKDMPFMTAFMATLVCGLKMVDVFAQSIPEIDRAGNSKRSSLTRRAVVWLLITGIFSGLTISIRILGPAAAGLVCFYVFMLNRPERWIIVFGLGATSMVMTYLTWPFLWGNPFSIFFQVLKTMLAFPWIGTVRFAGHNYLAGELPHYYLPELIGIQFTLPLILLAITGTVLLIRRIISKSHGWGTGIILLTWFWVPLVTVMILQPNSYDNFRQYLFITPPLFTMAGVAVDVLFGWLKRPVLRYLLAGILLLPGVIAGIWLHPYEYVYYNALVGWTGSVERSYETDYWATSMCEAGVLVSQQPMRTNVVILSDVVQQDLFDRCTKHTFELQVDPYGDLGLPADYVVVWSRFDDDLSHYANLERIHEIKRGKTVFAVIKSSFQQEIPLK